MRVASLSFYLTIAYLLSFTLERRTKLNTKNALERRRSAKLEGRARRNFGKRRGGFMTSREHTVLRRTLRKPRTTRKNSFAQEEHMMNDGRDCSRGLQKGKRRFVFASKTYRGQYQQKRLALPLRLSRRTVYLISSFPYRLMTEHYPKTSFEGLFSGFIPTSLNLKCLRVLWRRTWIGLDKRLTPL